MVEGKRGDETKAQEKQKKELEECDERTEIKLWREGEKEGEQLGGEKYEKDGWRGEIKAQPRTKPIKQRRGGEVKQGH